VPGLPRGRGGRGPAWGLLSQPYVSTLCSTHVCQHRQDRRTCVGGQSWREEALHGIDGGWWRFGCAALCCAGKLLTGNTGYRLALRAAATKTKSQKRFALLADLHPNIKYYIIRPAASSQCKRGSGGCALPLKYALPIGRAPAMMSAMQSSSQRLKSKLKPHLEHSRRTAASQSRQLASALASHSHVPLFPCDPHRVKRARLHR
jgi:hypothetical protein